MRHFTVKYHISIDADDIETNDMDSPAYQAAITITNNTFNRIWDKELTFMQNISKVLYLTSNEHI